MHESVEIRWSSKGTVKSMYFAEFKFPSNEFAKKIKKQVLTYETMKIPFLVVIWWKIIPFAQVDYNDQKLMYESAEIRGSSKG